VNDVTSIPKYSILITSFRSLRFLEECLGSLLNLDGPTYEVLFLDNGSPDAEAEWVRANIHDPRFRVFEVPDTRYFAGGVNYLADRAVGESLVLLNSDAKVDPLWLKTLDEYMVRTGYEAAGSDVRELGHPETPGDARWLLDPFGLVHSLPAAPGPVFTAGGCGMVIKRRVFFEAGRLDEDFKMYFEEVDLCWRLNLMNYRVGFAPGAIIHHVGQGSQKRGGFQWNRFRGRRNRIWSFLKNGGPALLAVFIPCHFVICLASILGNLLRGKLGFAVAESAALTAAIFGAGPSLTKRGAIQQGRIVSDAELVARGLFFVRVPVVGGLLALLFKKRADA
jgi:GT2 family glycosyltransferase